MKEGRKSCRAKRYVGTFIFGQFLRSCTARGSDTGLCCRGPAKVRARKSILFTEGSPRVERKSEHLFDISMNVVCAGKLG